MDSWELLKENGTLVTLVSDESVQFTPSPNKKFNFMRGVQGKSSTEVNQLIELRKIKPIIDQVYDFNDIAAAHIKSETGHVSGKLVIVI
ncbi:zinc-binding dehydrogenase [Acinetobacter faecalis]|uniref:Zinc-binding dehydrogenase n=1 Tax=Acinetobacter faecalis TaxID=2665161 RepID=A0ABU5GLV5_9GAMM|nr:zinc-binding dehydrogenase [Acinetobacter faecalis]MDY6489896.1 zinc-binding dehydrogenase [Acinetobacter faecalis]MDY6551235.1 zinc-binding dehydrogenase [Acinetobacter faecalis]